MRMIALLALVALSCSPAPPDSAGPVATGEVAVTAEAPAPAPPSEAVTGPAQRPAVPAPKQVRDPFENPAARAPEPRQPDRSTTPPPQVSDRKKAGKAEPHPLTARLTGVVLSPAGNRALVRVNETSRVLRVGDRLDGYRVNAIEHDRMILTNGSRRVLRLQEG